MMTATHAVVTMGVIDRDSLAEFARWGYPLEDIPLERAPSAEKAAESLEEALRRERGELPRETDFDILERYLRSEARGTLHVEDVEATEPAASTCAEFEVTYARTRLGEYIFAWRSEGIADLLTNGRTYLADGRARVFFSSVRELFFGDTKAFLVCTGSSVEVRRGDQS
jgi:hypothetical protein